MDVRPLSYLRKRLSGLTGGPVWRGGAGDIVLTLYDDGIIVDISASAGEIIGAAGNLIGRSLFDFVRRDDRAAVQKVLKQAGERRGLSDPNGLTTEFSLLRVRRSPARAEIVVKAIGRGRLQALIRDRGDEFARKRMARASQEEMTAPPSLSQKPASSPPSLSQPSLAQPDLVADLSHEMKTPLNAIMGFADAMRAETFGPLGDDKYKEYADDIHASGAHLMGLIGSILDFAKIEANQYKLSPALAEPGPLAHECMAMVRGEAEKAGLKLTLELAPELPELMLDAQAVKQILINLLTNAVKFTQAGEVKLSVSEKCGAMDFVVTDTGVGMSQAALAKLGGRFTDVHQNGVRGTKGTGLGLSLAFALAKLHGGALILNSAPGEGTTARLTLPVRRSLDELAPALQSRPGDIQSQLDRVARYRRERSAKASAA